MFILKITSILLSSTSSFKIFKEIQFTCLKYLLHISVFLNLYIHHMLTCIRYASLLWSLSVAFNPRCVRITCRALKKYNVQVSLQTCWINRKEWNLEHKNWNALQVILIHVSDWRTKHLESSWQEKRWPLY